MNQAKASRNRPADSRRIRRNPPRARRRRTPRQLATRIKKQQTKTAGKPRHSAKPRQLCKSYSHLKKLVFGLFTRKEVDSLARQVGFYRRKPKDIPAFEFVVCSALSALVEAKRGFASVWRMLSAACGICVARSAVTQRFGKGSAALLEELFNRAVDRLPQWQMGTPQRLAKLKEFSRVLADDGCVVRLSPLLGKLFPACRTNKMKAALKIHARADLTHRFIENVVVTGERGSERDVARDYRTQKGALYIRDLGYMGYDDIVAIIEEGGHILMRLKTNSNPVIVRVRHGVKAPKRSVGMKFQDIDFTQCHDTFDLDARFTTSVGSEVLRVVGHYNKETGKYHCYLTDLAPEQFSVEELETLYALRWVIELLFKLLKSSCHLDHVDTSDPDAMRTHIYSSLLASIILTTVVVAAAEVSGVPASQISILTVGIAAPMLVVPLMWMWLGRKLTHDELAQMVLRMVSHGCRDQNYCRTQLKWGPLS